MSMYDKQNPYEASYGDVAALAQESERTAFIRRTYAHLTGAVAMFIALETLIFTVVPAATLDRVTGLMLSGYNWLAIMVGFMFISWIANSWARNPGSQGKQYAGLLLYVVCQSVLFVPLLWIAQRIGGSQTIPAAGMVTGIIFVGLTGMVFLTRADFSWLGRFLCLAGFLMLGLIACSVFLPGVGIPSLAIIGLGIGLASGYILYDTSKILHHYNTNQHVVAALELFASVTLLLWYVIQLIMSLQSRD
jgi:FtsH-binding integral membrane protein